MVPLCGTPAQADGLSVTARYVADVWHGNGGLRDGTAYLDDARLQVTADLDKLFGTPGTLFVFARASSASDFAGRFGGEFQKISNIDNMPSAHLYEAWYERPLGESVSVRTGLYDLNSEFDVISPAALFLNSSQGIGPDFAQTGQNGPSIFPVTSLGARLAWTHDGITLRAAVLDGVPGDPADNRRTVIHLGNGDGALLAGEMAWSAGAFAGTLGAWHYTAAFDDLLAVTPAGSPVRRRDNTGGYSSITARFTPPESSLAVDMYLRGGIAQSAINTLSHYVGGGIVFTGLLPARPDDQFGISAGMATAGRPARTAAGLSHDEVEIEATYRAKVTSWLTLQPDVQLVLHPGLDPSARRLIAVGLRFEIEPRALVESTHPQKASQ